MPAKKTNNKKTGSDKNTEPKAKKEAKYNRQLRRSESDKIIAGVAGGIGQFFDIDPTFIRLIFVLLSIFGGGGVLLYFVLWLITPS